MNKAFLSDIIGFLFLLTSISIFYGCENVNENSEHRIFPKPENGFLPKVYIVHKTDDDINIDGMLNETIWQNVEWTDDFTEPQNGTANYRTRAKMVWDPEYLYVGAEIEEPHIWATMTSRDDPLYLDNAFEIFIDPDRDTHNYVEFEINALGTIWDLFIDKPYRDNGKAISNWNLLNYKSSVHLYGTINEPVPKDKKWTLEVALPLESLQEVNSINEPVSNGVKWKVNFQRTYRRLKIVNGEYELEVNPDTDQPYRFTTSVWSPQGIANIHYPEMWGVIQFSDTLGGGVEDTFTADPDQKIKWALRQVYYQMKEFYLNHGDYARKRNQLNVDSIKVDGMDFEPKVQVTQSMFEITSPGFKNGTTWHISQDGRIWKTD